MSKGARREARRRYGETLRAIGADEQTTRAKRDDGLGIVRAACAERRARSRSDISRGCATERADVRDEANLRLDALRGERRGARAQYSDEIRHRAKPGQRIYSRTESDHMAEMEIDAQRPELVELWRLERGRVPYDLPPDMRAHKWLEETAEDEENTGAWRAAQMPTDDEFSAQYAQHRSQLEAAPF